MVFGSCPGQLRNNLRRIGKLTFRPGRTAISPGAKSGQAVNGAVVLAFATGLQTIDDLERTAVIDQGSKCERDQGYRGFIGHGGFQVADFAVD